MPCIPLVTRTPVPSISLVTDSSAPCTPLVMVTNASVSCIPLVVGLEMCNRAVREHASHGEDPASSTVQNEGSRRASHSSPLYMGTMLRLTRLEAHGCSCHPMACASIPWGDKQHPLGTVAPPGDLEHPWRAWFSTPAAVKVAPECTQSFVVSPSTVGVPKSHGGTEGSLGHPSMARWSPWMPWCGGVGRLVAGASSGCC